MNKIPEKYLLYAEDDPDDREIITDMLHDIDPSLEVICVPDGRETLRFLDALPSGSPFPCCIVLDVNMPVWNGLYTLEQLKLNKDYAELPVFMFSSSQSRADYEKSLLLGALDFIHKPIRMSDMKRVGDLFSNFCQKDVRKK